MGDESVGRFDNFWLTSIVGADVLGSPTLIKCLKQLGFSTTELVDGLLLVTHHPDRLVLRILGNLLRHHREDLMLNCIEILSFVDQDVVVHALNDRLSFGVSLQDIPKNLEHIVKIPEALATLTVPIHEVRVGLRVCTRGSPPGGVTLES